MSISWKAGKVSRLFFGSIESATTASEFESVKLNPKTVASLPAGIHRVLLAAAVICGAGLIVLFLFIAVSHILFPYEIDWYEGVMLDHALRVLQSKPIYAMPSMEFAPALYQPLYYYAAAASLKLFGMTYGSLRILSVASTLVTTFLLYDLGRRLGNKPVIGLMSAGLFLGAFQATGYTYSLCRVDSLMLVLLVGSVYLALRSASRLALIGSAFLMAAAYMTKQEGLFYLPLIPLWLFLSNRKRGFQYAAVLAVFIAVSTIYLQLSTDGWYGHIAYYIPSVKSHSFGWLRTLSAIPYYFGRFWGASLVGIALFALSAKSWKFIFLRSDLGLLFGAFALATIQAAMHRGDQMSYTNVLLPFAAFSALLLPVLLGRTTESSVKTALLLCVIVQELTLFYNPKYDAMILPTAQDRSKGAALVAELSHMEGRIYLPSHGFLAAMAGKNMSAHSQTLLDFYIPNDWVSRKLKTERQKLVAQKAFSHIVQDRSPLGGPEAFSGYRLEGKLGAEFGSRIGDALTYPEFDFRPINN